MTQTVPAPYEELVELAERELELVGDGRLDELAELAARRAALIAGLPPVPPPAAGPALERAALMNRRVTTEILLRRDALLLELSGLEQVRRMARGYTPPRDRMARVDASA